MNRPIIAEGEKVVLVPLTEEDVDWLWREVNRRDTAPRMGTYVVFSTEDEKNFVQKSLKDKNAPHFLIMTKGGKRVGVIGVNKYSRYHGTAELGYWIAHSERGKGYGTEAIKLFVEYLFREANYRRLYAYVHANNPASQRVLEKNGFKSEGRLRKHHYDPYTSSYEDVLIFGLLRDEWKKE